MHCPEIRQRIAALSILALLLVASAAAARPPETTGTGAIVWRRTAPSPVAMSGGDLKVLDAAAALGFEISTDASTGVLTLSAGGHQVYRRRRHDTGSGRSTDRLDLPAGSDVRRRALRAAGSARPGPLPARRRGRSLRCRAPHVGRVRVHAAAPLDVAVVHVEPTTQVVLRESVAARFEPPSSNRGCRSAGPTARSFRPSPSAASTTRWSAAVRFEGDTATVVFREPSLDAHAYPLDRPGPDRGRGRARRRGAADRSRRASSAGARRSRSSSTRATAAPETGAIGPDGLQEKDVTLQIARRLAAAIPRGGFQPGGPDARLRQRDLARRSDLAREPREGGPVSLDPRQLFAGGGRSRLRDVLPVARDVGPGLAGRRAPRERLAPAAPRPQPRRANPDLDFILWDIAQSAHVTESSELAEAIQTQLNVRLGDREPRHQAGAFSRSRRGDDAGGSRRGRLHLAPR